MILGIILLIITLCLTLVVIVYNKNSIPTNPNSNYNAKPKIDLLHTKSDKLQGQVNTLNYSINSLNYRMDNIPYNPDHDAKEVLEPKIDSVDTKVKEVNQTILSINTKLDDKAEKSLLDNIVERVTGIETEMPQKISQSDLDVVTQQLSDLEIAIDAKLANKADITYVDSEIAKKADISAIDVINLTLNDKADKSYVNDEIAKIPDLSTVSGKADLTYVNSELAKKADQSALDAMDTTMSDKVNTTDMNTALALKADQQYVIDQLILKANQLYVNTELDKKVNSTDLTSQYYDKTEIDSQMNDKANISYVDTQVSTIASGGTIDISGKADLTYVDERLKLKANQSDITNITTTLNNKADNTDVANLTTELNNKVNNTDNQNYLSSLLSSIIPFVNDPYKMLQNNIEYNNSTCKIVNRQSNSIWGLSRVGGATTGSWVTGIGTEQHNIDQNWMHSCKHPQPKDISKACEGDPTSIVIDSTKNMTDGNLVDLGNGCYVSDTYLCPFYMDKLSRIDYDVEIYNCDDTWVAFWATPYAAWKRPNADDSVRDTDQCGAKSGEMDFIENCPAGNKLHANWVGCIDKWNQPNSGMSASEFETQRFQSCGITQCKEGTIGDASLFKKHMVIKIKHEDTPNDGLVEVYVTDTGVRDTGSNEPVAKYENFKLTGACMPEIQNNLDYYGFELYNNANALGEMASGGDVMGAIGSRDVNNLLIANPDHQTNSSATNYRCLYKFVTDIWNGTDGDGGYNGCMKFKKKYRDATTNWQWITKPIPKPFNNCKIIIRNIRLTPKSGIMPIDIFPPDVEYDTKCIALVQ